MESRVSRKHAAPVAAFALSLVQLVIPADEPYWRAAILTAAAVLLLWSPLLYASESKDRGLLKVLAIWVLVIAGPAVFTCSAEWLRLDPWLVVSAIREDGSYVSAVREYPPGEPSEAMRFRFMGELGVKNPPNQKPIRIRMASIAAHATIGRMQICQDVLPFGDSVIVIVPGQRKGLEIPVYMDNLYPSNIFEEAPEIIANNKIRIVASVVIPFGFADSGEETHCYYADYSFERNRAGASSSRFESAPCTQAVRPAQAQGSCRGTGTD